MAVGIRVLIEGRALRLMAIEHNNCCRVEDFFNDVAVSHREDFERLVSTMDELASSGPLHNEHIYKPLREGLHEIKVGVLRVMCFQRTGAIICTHGFVKSSQKTPAAELRTGRFLRAEFLVAEQTGTLIAHQDPEQL